MAFSLSTLSQCVSPPLFALDVSAIPLWLSSACLLQSQSEIAKHDCQPLPATIVGMVSPTYSHQPPLMPLFHPAQLVSPTSSGQFITSSMPRGPPPYAQVPRLSRCSVRPTYSMATMLAQCMGLGRCHELLLPLLCLPHLLTAIVLTCYLGLGSYCELLLPLIQEPTHLLLQVPLLAGPSSRLQLQWMVWPLQVTSVDAIACQEMRQLALIPYWIHTKSKPNMAPPQLQTTIQRESQRDN